MGDGLTENRRLDQLEERFTRTEDKVVQLDKSVAVYSAIFERTLQVHEKLSGAIDRLSETTSGLQTTLVGVIHDIKTNSEAQEKNSLQIENIKTSTDARIIDLDNKINNKIEKLDGKLNTVDEKGKFDILKFIKENFVSISFALYIISEWVISYLQGK